MSNPDLTELDRLAETWRRQEVEPARDLGAVLARMRELDRTVRIRDRIESGLALLIFPVFAYATFAGPFTIARLGTGLLALWCLVVPLRLRAARRPPADPTLPLVSGLRRELARVRSQERLLGSVLWWYLLPPGTGLLLMIAGTIRSIPAAAGAAAVVIALYWGILRLNRRAAREQLAPRALELESLIAGLEASPDTDAHGVV